MTLTELVEAMEADVVRAMFRGFSTSTLRELVGQFSHGFETFEAMEPGRARDVGMAFNRDRLAAVRRELRSRGQAPN